MLDHHIELVTRHFEAIRPAIKSVEPKPGGMLPSELLLFTAICLDADVTHVVESGRSLGYSTEFLSQFSQWEVISIETSPKPDADAALLRRPRETSLTLIRGDGMKLVPTLLRDNTAVLLDGPKNVGGLELYTAINKQCVICGIHDLCKGNEDGTDNPGRAIAEQIPGMVFSDDPRYRQAFSYIDHDWMVMSKYTDMAVLGVSCVLGVVKHERLEACS